MLSHHSRRLGMVLLCLGVFGIFGTPQFGWGLTLDEAKTQGLVGETPTGYLGAVQPGATAEVQALVNEINQKRRQAYADIAQRNGTRLEAVEMLAGEKAIGNTKPGNFVQLPSGQWIKK